VLGSVQRGRAATDYGRLAFVPVSVLLMLGATVRTVHDIRNDAAAGVHFAETIRGLLIFTFYGLLIRFYLLRGRPQRTTQSVLAFAGALVATFLPFAMPAIVDPSRSVSLLVGSNLVIAIGIAWSIWALRHLARNISVVPQARELVRSGPYAIVRHPLYVGEIIAITGVVAAGATAFAVGVLALVVGLQVYRAVQEEALLAECFPEYAAYAARTARFLPGVV
jgi:protein-S-isoprenylcysteine O-methyltransferase Ste14